MERGGAVFSYGFLMLGGGVAFILGPVVMRIVLVQFPKAGIPGCLS